MNSQTSSRIPYTSSNTPTLWCIGGSDSRAGAGIQADLLTAQDFGICAATIVSSVTAQSQKRVDASFPVPDEIFRQQLQSALSDGTPKAIKIGLIATQSQIEILVSFLKTLSVPVILDPVQIASTGDHLTDSKVDLSPLFPFCSLLTPNEDELAALGGLDTLKASGAKASLITGHASDKDKILDHYIDFKNDQEFFWHHKYIKTENTHGTGCTLSTAICASVARGYPMLDSITQGIAYVQKGLECGSVPNGNRSIAHKGWPNKPSLWPIPCRSPLNNNSFNQNLNYHESGLEFPKLSQPLGFYPVVDSVDLVKQLIDLGVGTLQLRIKTPDSQEELRKALSEAINYARHHNTQLFINDHWQLACELNAFGVHLGQEDLIDTDLNAIYDANLRLGISSHGFFEMCMAMACRPSYLALGHIFSTPTKQMPSKPQGLTRLASYAKLVPCTPTVAIGGINQSNAEQVLACGVDGVAVVRAVTESTNLSGTVNKFMNVFERAEIPHNINQRANDAYLFE